PAVRGAGVLRRAAMAALLALALSPVAPALASASSSSHPDVLLLRQAQLALAELRHSARHMARSSEWERVVLRFRVVAARYPDSGAAADALLAVGDLYREMAKRLKDARYAADATDAYEAVTEARPRSAQADQAR